jgi:hypothetical protein
MATGSSLAGGCPCEEAVQEARSHVGATEHLRRHRGPLAELYGPCGPSRRATGRSGGPLRSEPDRPRVMEGVDV